MATDTQAGVSGRNVANVTHHLQGIDFPANKQDLIKQAESNGADQDVIQVLQGLPDRQYTNMADVMQGYGEADKGGQFRSGGQQGGMQGGSQQSSGRSGGSQQSGGRSESGGGRSGGR